MDGKAVGDSGEETYDDRKLQLLLTSSSTLTRSVLDRIFGCDIVGRPEKEEVKNVRLGTPRWLYRVNLDCEQSVSAYLRAVDRFCKNFEGHGYLDADFLMQDIEDVVEADHRNLDVEYFALGSWTDLDIFIKHFSSVPPEAGGGERCRTSLTRIQASFYHNRGYLEIYFGEAQRGVPSGKLRPVFKLQLRYGNITKIVVRRILRHRDEFHDNNRREPMEIYLHTSAVTAYRWNSEEKNAYDYFFVGPWQRQEGFGQYGDPQTTYRNVGDCRVLAFKLHHKGKDEASAIYSLLRSSRAPVLFASVKPIDLPASLQALPKNGLSDDVQYALECIQSVAPYLSVQMQLANSINDVRALLVKLSQVNETVLIDSLYEIYYEAKKGVIIDFKVALEVTFEQVRGTNAGGGLRSVTASSLPQSLVLVKKVSVCPSKVVLEPPTVVQICPLLRRCEPDSALLVDLRDDDLSLLRTETADDADALILRAIFARLRKGLRVGSKQYHFLGASKVQFDEHSFWMYAKDSQGRTADDILKNCAIGGTVAERMAALDILLTEAISEVIIDPAWVREEGSPDDSPPATDAKRGIGRISVEAMTSITNNCGLQACAAIRVVHNSHVGVLVVDRDLDGLQIVYRRSQRSLPALEASNVMHVVATSSNQPAILDRVVITTLSSKREGLHQLIDPLKFTAIVSTTLTEAAAPFCDSSDVLLPKIEQALPHLKKTSQPIYLAEINNFDIRSDSLFRQALRCSQLKKTRELNALRLRMPRAYRLMAVVDEYDILEPDQIYVRVTTDGDPTVIIGENMVVARKDAMHPSEIRRFNAVCGTATEKLSHLIDCVVFSGKGSPPPLAWFCPDANYARDSEVFLIVNDDFHFRNNDKESTSHTNEPLPPFREPADGSLLSHYLQCVAYTAANNVVETFCGLSDHLPNRAYSEGCERLRRVRDQLDLWFRGRADRPAAVQRLVRYPDFLERISDRNTYCSNQALGACYRRMRLVEGLGEKQSCPNMIVVQDETDQQLRLSSLEGSDRFMKDAAKAMATFRKRLRSMRALYGLTIDEVVTGIVFTAPEQKYLPGRVARMESTLRCHLRHLEFLTQKQFDRGMANATEEERLQKMSAFVAYSVKNPEEGGYALPWMLSDTMVALIRYVELPKSVARENAIYKKMLRQVKKADDVTEVCANIDRNLFSIFSKWIRIHRDLLALSRHDELLDIVTKFLQRAVEKAWRELKSSFDDDSDKLLTQIFDDPSTLVNLLGTSLRMINASEFDSKTLVEAAGYERKFFAITCVRALMCNVLVKAAAYGSLDALLEKQNLVCDKLVNYSFLIPFTWTSTDEHYIRETRNNLDDFQNKLRQYSMCKTVTVKLLPAGEDETAYEEVCAFGQWFAVQNLITIMLMPDFRTIVVREYQQCYRANYQGDD